MLANLRSNWLSIRASYWFYPALFAAGGLLLALLLVHLDRIGAAEWLSRSHWIVPAQPDGANNILTVLSGSMIGVASTVFSITIAAVAYASGNYGPRLLTNFMEDKGNQFSLAMFIGTFVYAITVLRAVRGGDEAPGGMPLAVLDGGGFVPQLALLVAFALMIASVGVLVYFLHHIPASIRINTVLENIGARLLHEIEQRFPEEGESDPPVRAVARGDYVCAHRTGYVRLIELGALVDCARKHEIAVSLEVRPGDFVYPGIAIARTDATRLPDTVADSVRDTFAFGSSRTPEMDLEFSIDELVEIALRALSPGINDAFTAITATHWLGAATAELARRNLTRSFAEEGEEPHLVLLDDDFEHYLARGFGAIRSGVATNRIATLVMFDTLVDATSTLDDESRRAAIRQEGERLVRQAREHLAGPELLAVEARYQIFINAVKR